MALTSERRQQLRLALGYASVGLQVERTLENAMNAVDAQGRPELEAMIEAELDALFGEGGIDEQLGGALQREKYTRAEDVYFNVGGERAALKSVGSMHVRRLATLLSAPVRVNPFSSGGALGGVMKQG